MQMLLERAIDAIRYPTENPQTTLVVMLGVAVVGMLLAVVFIALASPTNRRSSASDDGNSEEAGPDGR